MRALDLPIKSIHTNICFDDDIELSAFDATVLDILDKTNFKTIEAAQYRPEYTAVLSDLRKNCVDWLPFRGDDTVLELGADYGQLTGVMADKVKEVCCFDFDLIRTGINFVRNQEMPNITYYAYDNFTDFEREMVGRKFDYIYMADAFSEAERYFPQSDDPGAAMLIWAKEHLSARGKIVLAVDNKYGLKFLNGSKILGEEFYGAPLGGATSLPWHRYFSRVQLENYLTGAGFAQYRFFYPLPEYKFTVNLYSDGYLPQRDELFCHNYTWEYDKISLLDEKVTFYLMAEDGTFRDFANSYLIVATVCTDMDEDIDAVQFVRFSSGRRVIYDICTSIICKNGERVVRKTPRTWQAKRHVADICENYKNLTAVYANPSVQFNRCAMNGDAVEFEYLQGRNLFSIINGYLASGEHDLVTAEYDRLFELLSQKARYFVPTKAFRDAFGGDCTKLLTLKAPLLSNVDMIPQNIIVSADGCYHIFDYEWTFPFGVPILFILWRGIMYQFLPIKGDKALFADVLYARYGIDDSLQKLFAKMELQFERYGYSQKRLDQYPAIGHTYPLRKTVQIFEDYGEGYEKGNFYVLNKNLPLSGKLIFELEISGNLKALRVDPCSQKCLLRIKSITDDHGRNVPYATNGTPLGDGCFFYRTTDPQVVIRDCDKLEMKTVRFDLVLETILPGIEEVIR